MGKGINKCTIVGNLGADPDVRYSANGNAVTKIRVATSDQWKDKQTGETQERTEWHRIVAFGRLGEIMGQFLQKGSQVYIEGRLQTSKYERDGQTHYSTDIIAHEMQMLGGGHQAAGGQQETKTKPAAPPPGDDFDDDIPFS